MAEPIVIAIPHRLSRDEVRRRMASRVGDVPRHIPGGLATVSSSWPTVDRILVNVSAFGHQVPCTLDVEDHVVRVSLTLPGLLSLMAGPIAAIVRQRGDDLLEDGRSKKPV